MFAHVIFQHSNALWVQKLSGCALPLPPNLRKVDSFLSFPTSPPSLYSSPYSPFLHLSFLFTFPPSYLTPPSLPPLPPSLPHSLPPLPTSLPPSLPSSSPSLPPSLPSSSPSLPPYLTPFLTPSLPLPPPHCSLLHLILSIIFSFFILRHVEKRLGWLRTAILYLVSGVGGNLVSVFFVPYNPGVSGGAYPMNEVLWMMHWEPHFLNCPLVIWRLTRMEHLLILANNFKDAIHNML